MSIDQVQRGSRGPYLRSRRTQEALLDAAFTVFSEVGYRNGAVREIAERAGVSVSSLLHHFDSKAGLLIALMNQRDQQASDFVDWSSHRGRGSLIALLDVIAYNMSTPSVTALYCVVSAEAATSDHPAREYFVDRQAGVRTSIAAALFEIQEEGGLRAHVDPDLGGVVTTAVLEGLQLQWLLNPSSVDMAGALRAHLNSYLTEDL